MENENHGDLLHGSSSRDAAAAPVQAQLKPLYFMLCLAFAGLLLANLGVTGLFWWQTRLVRQQLDQNRKALAKYERVDEPRLKEVLNKLEAYGQQDAEYQPLLKKYQFLFPRLQQMNAAPLSGMPIPGPTSAPAASQ